jgi:hypothetical protein
LFKVLQVIHIGYNERAAEDAPGRIVRFFSAAFGRLVWARLTLLKSKGNESPMLGLKVCGGTWCGGDPSSKAPEL